MLLVPDPDLAITGLVAARLRRIAVVADVHEDYVGVAEEREWSRGPIKVVARAVARVAALAASRADVTVLTDPEHRPFSCRRRTVVLNVPGRGELGDVGTPDERPRAVYIGDVRVSRGLHAMVEAVLATDDWCLDIVGPIQDEDAAWVATRTSSAPDRITLHGRLAPPDAWKVAEGAWVGLSLLQDNPAFRVIMPTKIYEYLSFGLPVISTPLPRVLERIGTDEDAVTLTGEEDAAAILRRWSTDRAAAALARAAAARWRDEHIPARSPFDEAADVIASLR